MNPSIIDTLPIPEMQQPSSASSVVSSAHTSSSVEKQTFSEANPATSHQAPANINVTGNPGPTTLPGVGSTKRPETDADFQKRWVSIAKTIIARTKHDPYLQSIELNKAGRKYREELQTRE